MNLHPSLFKCTIFGMNSPENKENEYKGEDELLQELINGNDQPDFNNLENFKEMPGYVGLGEVDHFFDAGKYRVIVRLIEGQMAPLMVKNSIDEIAQAVSSYTNYIEEYQLELTKS